MPRKPHQIHYIYKTTCLITNRYYIGMHSTSNINDLYLGSGLRLRRSIRKYGRNNHIKEILEFLPNRDSLIMREKEIVNSILIEDSLCMNLKPGGSGGLSSKIHAENFHKAGGTASCLLLNKKHPDKLKNNIEYRERYCQIMSKTTSGEKNGFFGKKHSIEYKEKMSEIQKIKQKGILNSQYGKCWIYNDILKENKSIKTEDFDKYQQLGWSKGRKNEYNKIKSIDK